MKKAIIVLIGLWLLLPVWGACQSITEGELTVFAGVEYPTIESDHFPEINNLNEFIVEPHLQVSYEIPVYGIISSNIFMGYSVLGGMGYYTLNQNEYRQRLKMNVASLGIKGVLDLGFIKTGPVFGMNRILKTTLINYIKQGGEWRTDVKYKNYDRFLSKYSTEIGWSIQRKIISNLTINIESMFGLIDIFTNEEQSPVYPPPSIRWLANHHRVSIGYSF